MGNNFRKYEKIPRLTNSACVGLTSGDVWMFPKLDGTNGSIWVADGQVACGSRNRTLKEGEDNAGFMAHVMQNNRLLNFMSKCPEFRLYGEWLVPHTVKDYEDNAWKVYYIYDVHDGNRYLTYEEYRPMLEAHHLEYIPAVLLKNPSPEDIEVSMRQISTYLMKDQAMGEGVVLKNYGFVNKFGDAVYGKYINDGFQNRPKKVFSDAASEQAFVEDCVSWEFIEKVATKILVAVTGSADMDGWDRKSMIPRLLETAFKDLVEEKLYDYLKKAKMPTLQFGRVRGLLAAHIKAMCPEYFQ